MTLAAADPENELSVELDGGGRRGLRDLAGRANAVGQ